jgi:glycosidase
MTYWLDLGVDGFRVDSVTSLVEGDYGADEAPLVRNGGTTGMRWEDYDHRQTVGQQGSYDLAAHWRQLVYNYSLRDGKERYPDRGSYFNLGFYGMAFYFSLLKPNLTKLKSLTLITPRLQKCIDILNRDLLLTDSIIIYIPSSLQFWPLAVIANFLDF